MQRFGEWILIAELRLLQQCYGFLFGLPGSSIRGKLIGNCPVQIINHRIEIEAAVRRNFFKGLIDSIDTGHLRIRNTVLRQNGSNLWMRVKEFE
jgi:hypothetical protein